MQNDEYKLAYTKNAEDDLKNLIADKGKKVAQKAVHEALKKMQHNLRHPSLNTHKYNDMSGPKGEDIFESYAQNNTPGAYRIFWFYGPSKKVITVVAITPHP